MTATTHHDNEGRQLPPGWRVLPLGDCGEVVSGVTLGRRVEGQGIRDVPYLRVANVKDGHLDLADVTATAASAEEIAALALRQGDLLLTEGGDADKLGRGTVWEGQLPECIHQNHIFRIRLDTQEFEPAFVAFQAASPYGKAYFLQHAKQTTGIATINQCVLRAFPLMVPPLPEQQRIAAVLREQMAAVAKARAAAQARLEAANALSSACLRAVFEASEAAAWPTRRLGEVLVPHKEIIHPGERESGTATFVGLEHVESHTGRRIGSSALDLVHLTGRKPTFRRGQIVYGYLRPYLNKVWIAEFDGCSSVDQFAYDVQNDLADVRFVAWFMRSPTYLRRSQVMTTTGQLPRIGTEEIAAVEIGLPSVGEQRAIADAIDHRLATRQRLSELLCDEADAIGQMPAALLRRAFAGET